MTTIHIHLFLSHFPIISVMIITAFLLHSFWRKKTGPENLFAFVLLAISLLVMLAVYFSGEPTSLLIEEFPSISPEVLIAHEFYGKASLFAGVVTFLMTLFLIFKLKTVGRQHFLALLVCLVGLNFTLVAAGLTGVKIRHTEVRNIHQNFSK